MLDLHYSILYPNFCCGHSLLLEQGTVLTNADFELPFFLHDKPFRPQNVGLYHEWPILLALYPPKRRIHYFPFTLQANLTYIAVWAFNKETLFKYHVCY